MRKDDLLSSLSRQVDEKVIKAMDRTPRELFVPPEMKVLAYEDRPLPIGCGQTISAPHMVAYMCHILDLKEGMRVLEVGTGFGYHAAVIARMVEPEGHVYTIERIPELADRARENLAKAGVKNVTLTVGDGSNGWPEHAPYDRISVAASAPRIPEPLVQELVIEGKLVIPVGSYDQELLLVTRTVEGYSTRSYMGVIFVPLIGNHGFRIGDGF